MKITVKSNGFKLLRASVAALALATVFPAHATDPAEKKGAETVELVPAKESETGKMHRITINGKTLNYRASAGTLIIRDDAGNPRASMFYVAYTVEGQGKNRPLTFLNNGGPGSASLWLNIGGFGPKRAPTATPKSTPPAPYVSQDNPFSILDKSDLIFLDAIGTGYSRMIGDAPVDEFWGTDEDIDSFARGITRYISKYDRWNSPRFLFGESYGTTRSAGLVYKLQNQGMDFNGVIMLSTLLNSGTGFQGSDIGSITSLPTYAASAWFHKPAIQAQGSLAEHLQKARTFAMGPYAAALLKGDTVSPQENAQVMQQMSELTGLPIPFLTKKKMRVGMEDFREQLRLDEGIMIGRFDTRFTAPASYAAGNGNYDPATNDAATAGVNSAHLSIFRQHLVRDIGFESDLHYRPLYNGPISAKWNNSHKAPGIDRPLPFANTGLDLAGAMQRNPNLKILMLAGIYDLSTPFAEAEYDISQLYLTPNLRQNIQFIQYESGHMTYVDDTASAKMKADLDRFYDSATHP
ncbi:MAG: peptidase S10 [Sphingobium sp.]|nr:peptidase S10 [Sphingobium sp.]